jgi:hypothetical protein
MANTNPTWNDFYSEGLGPQLPLSAAQRQSTASGVLPSGEGGGFDYIQDRTVRGESEGDRGSGINQPFPYPNEDTEASFKLDGAYTTEWWDASGIIKTAGPDGGELYDPENESSVLGFNGLSSNFSNSQDIVEAQIDDFTIFNNYIHHERIGGIVSIPYISTYNVAIDFRPYF